MWCSWSSSSPGRAACLVLALSLSSLTVTPARADRKEQARVDAERGDRAFRKAAYDEALAAYQASFERYPKPFLLFRIAECQRALGRDAEALASYQAYLTKVTRGPDRRKAAAYAQQLTDKLAAQQAAAPPPQPAPVPQASDVEAPPIDAEQAAALEKQRRKNRKEKAPPPETTATAPKPDHMPPGWEGDAPPAPVPADEPPRGPLPLYKKWWLWTAVGGGAAVMLGLTLGLVYGLPKFTSELPVGGPGAAALTVHPLTVRF